MTAKQTETVEQDQSNSSSREAEEALTALGSGKTLRSRS